MRRAWLALSAVLLLGLCPRMAACKDFPEGVLAVDPLAAAARPGLPSGMGAAFEYGDYAFSHDEVDSFYFRVGASPVFADLGEVFALGANFESILMCGPVKSGTQAANIAAFWMNAVQFQYGLYASLALPLPGSPRLLAEYSRTSQHPLGSPDFEFSQVAADFLVLGLAVPEFGIGPVSIRSNLRGGYASLFAFWQSSLPQPRMSWLLWPSVEAELPFKGDCALVARAYPEIFVDRFTDLLDADLFAEAGLIFAKSRDSVECLFNVYDTKNSDLLAPPALHPTFEAGLALRFSYDRAGSPCGL